jgi:hypothetical protein
MPEPPVLRPDLPAVAGVLTAEDVLATARTIASVQEAGGGIPWFAGGHVDPWDHIECAMALSVAGLQDAADRAYAYLRRTQCADGSWPSKVQDGAVIDASSETNQCAYVAVGVWHQFLMTADEQFAWRMWPTVRAAIDFVITHQTDRGEIHWSVDADRNPRAEALLTGSSSTYQSLRCALALASWVGESRPDWELAAGRLGHVLRAHPEAFLDKSRFSMDWYYPVLGGAVRGQAAHERINSGWDEFVVPGLGIRCVNDEPWVTGAETSELVLALDAIGDSQRAVAMLADVQHLRTESGAYWTGYQFRNEVNWPAEHSTWTAAAVILATDALAQASPAHAIFRADGLPAVADLADLDCCESTVGAA